MISNDIENLNKRGIYKIYNTINDIVYIGSTWQSFFKRYQQHTLELKKQTHKNAYLQNFVNKYGIDVLNFEILEIIEDKNILLNREDYWLNYFENLLFNINLKATGGVQFSKEIIDKRTNSFKEFSKIASDYYKNFKNKLICFNDIPKKYQKRVGSICEIDNNGFFIKRKDVWNKGLTKKDHNYSYLKVPKTKTKDFYNGRKQVSEKARKRGKCVLIFDINNNFIREFDCPKSASEWCTLNYDDLPIISNKNTKVLDSCNIIKCCKGKTKSYKGLIFKYKNLE